MPKRILCLSICFFLCATAAFSEDAPELLAPIGVRLDTEKVIRGPISEIECFEGAVTTPVHELWFEVEGKLLNINVLIGDEVKAGDVLLTLDDRDIVRQIEKLDDQIDYTQKSYAIRERMMLLEVEKMNIEYLHMKEDGADEKALALKQFDILAARREIDQEKERFFIELYAVTGERDTAFAKTGRDKIVAPCGGRVVYIDQQLNPGDDVRAYTTLVCVSDDAKKMVTSKYVSEMRYAGNSRVSALIGGKEYPLTPIPADMKKNLAISLKGGELYSEFELSDEKADDVEIGQYALVCLESRRKEDVLLIPKNALQYDAAGRFVYKVVDGVRVRNPVKVGLSTKIAAEVLEGLSEGDEVYVKD